MPAMYRILNAIDARNILKTAAYPEAKLIKKFTVTPQYK